MQLLRGMLCTPTLGDGLDNSPFFCAMVNTETQSSGHPRAASTLAPHFPRVSYLASGGTSSWYCDYLECSLGCPLPLVLGKNTVTVPYAGCWKQLTMLVNQKAFEKMQEKQ